MNLIEFLRTAKIIQKLCDQNLTEFQKVYASVQNYSSGCVY